MAGSSSTRPTTAPMLKFCWPTTCLYTSVAITGNWPPMTLGMPKSVTTRVKTTTAAETRPPFAPGSVTVAKMRARPARSADAAS